MSSSGGYPLGADQDPRLLIYSDFLLIFVKKYKYGRNLETQSYFR